VLLIAFGGLFFAMMGAMAKAASGSIPTIELVAARFVVTLAVIELVRRRSHAPLAFYQLPMLLSRSIAGFFGIACYFYALQYISLGDAVLLNNASPVLTSLGAVWLLGERMTATKAIALLASIGGVWFLVHDKTGVLASRGALVGALSAVASAWALVSLKIATRQNRSVMVVWSLAAVGCVISAAVGLWQRNWIVPGPRDAWLMLGTGALSAVAQLAMTMGYRLLDASEAAIYSYATPLFAVLLEAVWFARAPSPWTLAGGTLIIGAGAGVAWTQRAGRLPAP
jgi:drug/metabolite transporter (DMT)-like permease